MCDCLGNNDIYFYDIMDDSLLTKAMLNLIYRVLIFGRLVCHIAKVGRKVSCSSTCVQMLIVVNWSYPANSQNFIGLFLVTFLVSSVVSTLLIVLLVF